MKSFNHYLKNVGEYGEVIEIRYPLITVAGLPNVRSRELIYFENGTIGEVFSIHSDATEIVILDKKNVNIGDRATRTDTFISIPVGRELLGSTINPMGEFIDSLHKNSGPIKNLSLDVPISGIQARAIVTQPLHTGVMLIDSLLPLGRGQKELIIGDRRTGKTSFLLTTVKNQVTRGALVIYAAIASKQENIRQVLDYFKMEKISDKVVSVITTPFDSPGLIYLTPFTAMTIAEYFRDQGKDTLVIFDDLTSHAKFYREISLIGRRFPGRESYPGDIFYTHARLIERAGNFKLSKLTNNVTPRKTGRASKKKKEVSITCLPVVETVEGDLTSYISTNIMAMTDGHIFFDKEIFAKGRRPAVNISLSVTRVGKQTQSSLKRDVNQKLTKLLTAYEKMSRLAHFGAELSGKVQKTLLAGEKMYALFNQISRTTIPDEIQLILIALVWSDEIKVTQIDETRSRLIQAAKTDANLKKIEEIISSAQTLYDLQLNVKRQKSILWKMMNLGLTGAVSGSKINQTITENTITDQEQNLARQTEEDRPHDVPTAQLPPRDVVAAIETRIITYEKNLKTKSQNKKRPQTARR